MRYIQPSCKCDLCQKEIKNEFYGAKLGPLSPAPGRMALMCRDCFVRYGVGTGIGRGQHYRGTTGDPVGFAKIA